MLPFSQRLWRGTVWFLAYLISLAVHDMIAFYTDHPAAVVNVGGSLGAHFLLWETATAVAGYLLGINPFDQWGVEYGKELAKTIEPELERSNPQHDSSTNGLIAFYRASQNR